MVDSFLLQRVLLTMYNIIIIVYQYEGIAIFNFDFRRKNENWGLDQNSTGLYYLIFLWHYIVQISFTLQHIKLIRSLLFLIDPHLGTTISWILTNIAYPLSLSETVIFWFIEYPNSTIKIGGFPFYLVLHVHTFQVLFTLQILSIKWQAATFSKYCFGIKYLLVNYVSITYLRQWLRYLTLS